MQTPWAIGRNEPEKIRLAENYFARGVPLILIDAPGGINHHRALCRVCNAGLARSLIAVDPGKGPVLISGSEVYRAW